MIINMYADPNPCGAARFSGTHYVVAARKSSIFKKFRFIGDTYSMKLITQYVVDEA